MIQIRAQVKYTGNDTELQGNTVRFCMKMIEPIGRPHLEVKERGVFHRGEGWLPLHSRYILCKKHFLSRSSVNAHVPH